MADGAARAGLVDVASPSAEPFRMLRLAIDLRPNARSGNAIVVTSPHQGDGKSTIAANYAAASSLTGGSVLLIDADLRNPTLHRLFGVPRSPGLVEIIRDSLPLADARQPTAFPGLDLLTGGSPVSRPGDLAGSPQMAALLERAQKDYALVVVDAPPVLIASDAAGIASHKGVDALLVVRRRTKRRHVVGAVRKLQLTEANVLGLVINLQGRVATYAY